MATKQHRSMKDANAHVIGWITIARPEGLTLGFGWVDPASGSLYVHDGSDLARYAKSTEVSTPLFGTTAPSDDDGQDGDTYLNTNTLELYQKAAGAWGDPIATLGGEGGAQPTTSVTTKTTDYVVQLADLGTSVGEAVFEMSAALTKTFTLPSVGASDVGKSITLAKSGSGQVVVQAADSDTIMASVAGGNIYNDTAETDATITLLLIAETRWVAFSGSGTWKTDLP